MYCVLGSKGFLGQECVKYLKLVNKPVYESTCRLTSAAQDIIKSGARYVICAAGISCKPTIEWSETHEEETRQTNYIDMLELMETCRTLGVHLTIFGSGGVYSGKQPVYTEEDVPDFDQKVYFKYRILLEQKLQPHVLYLRIMYPCTFDGNPKCFYQKIWSRRNNLHNVSVSITSVRDLFPLIPTLVEMELTGIFNFVNKGSMALKDLVKVQTCADSEEQRGSYELACTKLEKYVKVPPLKVPYVLIVGAGLTGCTLARCLAEKGRHVRIIESRDHIGGNCYDFENEHGIRIHKYGPHFFHTNNSNVWNFVNRFADFIPYQVKLRSKVEDDMYVPIPVNIETVNRLFGMSLRTSEEMEKWLQNVQTHYVAKNSKETALNLCGPALYSLLFRGYTRKQWNRDASELDPSVLRRIPIHTSHYDGAFTDTYQGLPADGYTNMFGRMIDHSLIRVETSTDYFKIKNTVRPLKTYYTGRIDTYYKDSGFEPLEYRSLQFVTEHYEQEYYQPYGVINFPDESVPWTRCVEYKYFPNHSSNSSMTTIVKEYPMSTGEPYYPVPNIKNEALYQKYQKLASNESDVIFSGRLATYKYYNMDQAIEAAFSAIEQEQ